MATSVACSDFNLGHWGIWVGAFRQKKVGEWTIWPTNGPENGARESCSTQSKLSQMLNGPLKRPTDRMTTCSPHNTSKISKSFLHVDLFSPSKLWWLVKDLWTMGRCLSVWFGWSVDWSSVHRLIGQSVDRLDFIGQSGGWWWSEW